MAAKNTDAAPRATRPDADVVLGDDAVGTVGFRKRAILVSVDGLGATYVQQQLTAGKLPNFAALQKSGASTLNARADYEDTFTLPNHTTMLTGRPVAADEALPNTTHHGWIDNFQVSDPTLTLHNGGNHNLTYVASVFDVAHDHGLSTCLYAGKSKFTLFSTSYGSKHGAPDRVGEDDGCNKIDKTIILDPDTESLITLAESDLAASACDFAFIHIADMDWLGHSIGWGSEEWLAKLEIVDGWIGRIAAFADGNRTTYPFNLVVTADHGGVGYDHSDPALAVDYTIPFYAIGPEYPPNSDLYTLAGAGRADPGDTRPRYSAPLQPVRNADAANAITRLLGLPDVPGSFMRNLLK